MEDMYEFCDSCNKEIITLGDQTCNHETETSKTKDTFVVNTS